MDGVQHEFQSVEGVVEDVTDIVLNLKKVLIIKHKSEPAVITLDVEKEGEITAGDISPVEGIEIINPEQVILTNDRKQRVFAELDVTVGRGFCLGEDSKQENQPTAAAVSDTCLAISSSAAFPSSPSPSRGPNPVNPVPESSSFTDPSSRAFCLFSVMASTRIAATDSLAAMEASTS